MELILKKKTTQKLDKNGKPYTYLVVIARVDGKEMYLTSFLKDRYNKRAFDTVVSLAKEV